MKKVLRIIEYFKDVKRWISHYPKGWYKEKTRKVALRNALYCVAPARWKKYNIFLDKVFKF
jgi:hypothetical protein